MPQLEDHALARRQLLQRPADPRAQLTVPETPLRVAGGAIFLHRIGAVYHAIRSFDHRRLLLPDLPLAQMIETDVRHNPVKPGIKAAIEPEQVDILINPQESFRSEEHTSELQSHSDLVCRLLLEKKKTSNNK